MAELIPIAPHRGVFHAQVAGETLEECVRRLANAQAGVVSRGQLLRCGLTAKQIEGWLRTGRLVRLYRGVYALGHACLRPEGLRMAAVLAGGLRAVLSHRSAAEHWGLRADRRGRFELTAPQGGTRRVPEIDVHHARLRQDDVTVHHGVPVTSVSRTLVDLAAVLPGSVDRAIDRAVELQLFDLAALERQFRRGRPGVQAVRACLDARHPESERSRSELERAAVRLIAARGLPQPQVGTWLATPGYEVDLLWREQRVVVELDGWRYHRSRGSFERDRRKTVELQDLGYAVLRFTWRQIQDEPDWVVARVRAALSGQRGWAASASRSGTGPTTG